MNGFESPGFSRGEDVKPAASPGPTAANHPKSTTPTTQKNSCAATPTHPTTTSETISADGQRRQRWRPTFLTLLASLTRDPYSRPLLASPTPAPYSRALLPRPTREPTAAG
jgi:hypothetical protein